MKQLVAKEMRILAEESIDENAEKLILNIIRVIRVRACQGKFTLLYDFQDVSIRSDDKFRKFLANKLFDLGFETWFNYDYGGIVISWGK